jgi:hypothetical protein
MASTYLTPTAVTRAIATILHQKGNFLRRINKQYDAQYAVDGQRKGGGSLKIRLPNQWSVRTGTTMNVQDVVEDSVTLTIGTMKGVDMNFSDTDLALSIEDFTQRFITPAVTVLVSSIEADLIQDCANGISNVVDNDAAAISFLNVMQARQKLIENLAPDDDTDLTLMLNPTHNTKLVDAIKGLYVPVPEIAAQYRGGMFRPAAGVGAVGVSTHLGDLTTGTGAKGDTSYNVTAVSADGLTLTVDTGSTTFKKGEKITVEGCNAVHPETKADLGYLKSFAVAADVGTSGTSITLTSPLLSSGARQTVSAAPASNGAVSKLCAGNGEKMNRTMYFHRDCYAVAFADLENPKKYGAWGDTQVVDGISVRLWRQGDIVNGNFPCRLDVLYGGKIIRPQLGSLIHADA